MSNVEIELDIAGLREFRCSPEVQTIVMDKANAIVKSLGSGYAVEAMTGGKTRFRAKVKTTTWDAYHDAKDNDSLLHAIGGGS